MSDLAGPVITAIAAVGGSAAFLEVLRRWLQRGQDKRQEQLQLDVRIRAEDHALRQDLTRLCPPFTFVARLTRLREPRKISLGQQVGAVTLRQGYVVTGGVVR